MHVQPRFTVPGSTGATPTGSLFWPLASRPSDGQRYPPVDSVPYLDPEGASVTRETASNLAFQRLACQSPIHHHITTTLAQRSAGVRLSPSVRS